MFSHTLVCFPTQNKLSSYNYTCIQFYPFIDIDGISLIT